MTVYIGNAVGDEHGKARGGEAGDQTDKEIRIQPWYKSPKGWLVFRPKSSEVADKLVYCMKAACENPNIGYDQSERNTLYRVAQKVGFDCAKVDTPCECDCSSLVRVCLAYAGLPIKDFNTASEPSRLIACGQFDELDESKYTDSSRYLKEGDILVTATKGHTAIVLNNGPDAEGPEPEPQPEPPIVDKAVKVIGKSVRIRKGYTTLSKTVKIAHRGEEYPFVAVAPSGWYCIDLGETEAYITNKEKYTKLVEK